MHDGLHPRETYIRKSDGAIHREDGPARVLRDNETGEVLQEDYYVNNQLHRDDDQPAKIIYGGIQGSVCFEAYFQHGLRHRDERLGPAVIEYDNAEGLIGSYRYITYGQLHRSGGKPASICYDHDANRIAYALYYVCGECRGEVEDVPNSDANLESNIADDLTP